MADVGSFNDLSDAQRQEDLQIGGSYGYDYNRVRPIIQRQQDAFTQTFQNLLGRQPTPDEINSFFSSQYGGQVHPDLLDPYNTAQAYTANAFGPQIADYNKQQQTTQLGQTQKTIQDLIKQQTAGLSKDLSDPNSLTYQQFSGGMNNMGITPSSGAFQAGLGGVLGQSATNAINAALGSVSLPAISGIGQVGNNPYQQALSAPNQYSSQSGGMNDFELQRQLAQSLSGGGGSNTLGNIAALLQGGGQAAQGASATKSYICREMIKRGLLCERDFEEFYLHLFPAIIRKGRAFWNYFLHGQKLVNIANRVYPEWAEDMKPLFFNRVMAEKDPIKAVHLYADALKTLCDRVAPQLWDERNMRTSLFDSAWFVPRLMFCKPYRDNFCKLIRIKMLLLYDMPSCGVHR